MEYVFVIVLIAFSAIFSGLSLGFFSLNKEDLERKAHFGDERAKKIFDLRKKGNLLLSTLLIGNVTVNSTLSIFLGTLVPSVMAGFVATGMIVIFGEIVPQAVFSRYALNLGSRFVWLAKIFIIIFYPVAGPIAWALDKFLGEEMPTIYSKREIMKIVEDHGDSKDGDIDADEEKVIKGALSFSSKTVYDILTPRTAIFSLPFEQKLDDETMKKICEIGHSRVPVYKKDLDNIVGVLYLKDLLSHDYRDKKVGDVARENVIFVDSHKPLDDLLSAFKSTRNHMFIVLDKHCVVSGIVTIEDVLEEIIGAEIVDEYDKDDDLQKVARNKIAKKNLKRI